jgi:hypothetical protein
VLAVDVAKEASGMANDSGHGQLEIGVTSSCGKRSSRCDHGNSLHEKTVAMAHGRRSKQEWTALAQCHESGSRGDA